MPFAPFTARPTPHALSALRVRITVIAALLGIAAALAAYGLAPRQPEHHRSATHSHRIVRA